VTISDARETLRPGSVDEAVAAVRDTGDRTLLLRGAGTKLGWGAPVDADVELDTRGLDRLVAHNAGDMTAEVGAGMPLARLQQELAGAGQWLALDPPHPDATVGGIMAAGDAGPRRLRYGTVRDLVIGSAFVLPDATLTHSGSHVIKNVAGFDTTRLLTGSLGALGLIVQVIVRLHPLPAASATVRVRAGIADASGLALALAASPIEPSAVTWHDGTMLVRLEGAEDGVAAAVPLTRKLAGARSLDSDTIEGDDEGAAWAGISAATAGNGPLPHRDEAIGLRSGSAEDATVARAGVLQDRLPAVADALTRAASEHGAEAGLVAELCVGVATASLTGGGDHASVVTAWRDAVEGLGGTVSVRRAASGVEVPAWGSPPSAVALMRRVKAQLDPDGRFGPGRFAPWL
jgi:glycolate oxidase FAD binding subunit